MSYILYVETMCNVGVVCVTCTSILHYFSFMIIFERISLSMSSNIMLDAY